MHKISPTELATVVGGASKNDQLTLQLTTLQTSIKDIASNANGGNANNNQLMLMVMLMAMRPQPAMIGGGGGAPVASGPVINVSTRLRRW